MTRPVFDSTTFIRYSKYLPESELAKMAVSSVVLYELTANTLDRTQWQHYTALRQASVKNGMLLTPTMQDWWECSKAVARIRFDQKLAAHGQSPKDPNPTRLQNDALIARTVWLRRFYLVTDNDKDFDRIKPFIPVETVAAQDYFGF